MNCLVVALLEQGLQEQDEKSLIREFSRFGMDCEIRVCNVVRAPLRVAEIMARYDDDDDDEEQERPMVFVAFGQNANSVTSFQTLKPVIFANLANTKDAALSAAKIFALSDKEMVAKVKRIQQIQSNSMHVEDCNAKSKVYLPKIIQAVKTKDVFIHTDLNLTPKGSNPVERYVGKVRDRYSDGKNVFLITTDRLTGFDRPLCNIPFKGQVLNEISKWWFKKTEHIIKNHIVSTPKMSSHPNLTVGRSCKPFPIEFVVRGYLTGSSGTSILTFYKNGGRDYCGIKLPEGMVPNQKLEKNIITPTTKSDEHDMLISPEEIVRDHWMTQEEWDYCSAKALELFAFGQKIAAERGLILVDTKYEIGRDTETNEILLIDEIHTPDSSRYWIADSYDDCMKEGKSPANIDKEFIRLWFRDHCDPYKDEVLPEAPEDLVIELSRRYVMLYELITGEDFAFSNTTTTSINDMVQAVIDLQNT